MSGLRAGRFRCLLVGLPLPAALLTASLVFVLHPGLAYASLETALLPALPLLAACGLFLAVLAALPGAFGEQRWRDDYGALLAALGMGLWGSSLLSRGPHLVLDGRPHEIFPDLGDALLNLLLVLAISAGAYMICRRRPVAARFFLWVLNGLFAATAVVAVARTPAVSDPYQMDFQRLATFSRNGNVLIVLLDTYQSALFQRSLVQTPLLREELDGFVYFQNANSSAPTTLFSVPAIHSGKVYSPEEAARKGFDEYFSASVEDQSFLAELSKSGYRTQLLNPILHRCPRGADCYQEHVLHMTKGENLVQSSLFLLGLSLYTVAPLQWKQLAYNNGNWLIGENPMHSQVMRGYGTLDWLAASMRVDGGPATAKFFHLLTTHLPPVLDENCAEAKHPGFTEKELLDQARCTNAAVLKLLAALRSEGVYDNSMIVVLADHGVGIADDGFYMGGKASPLLLVKKPGSSGQLKIDESLISLTQIKGLVCSTTGVCSAHDSNERLFTDYRWDSEGWIRRGTHAINWYRIDGPPTQLESWRRLGPAVPPVRSLQGNESDPFASYGFGWVEAAEADGKTYWSNAPISSLFLSLPEARPYSVSLTLESHPVLFRSAELELYADGERVASAVLAVDGVRDLRLSLMGRTDRAIELRLGTIGISKEEYSLDRRSPLFRISRLTVD